MPSRFWVPLPSVRIEAVRLEHLHAAVSRWFDDTPADHGALVKPYAISPPARSADGSAGFELTALSSGAEARLRSRSGAGAGIRLGAQLVSIGLPVVIRTESWESLALASGRRSWTLDFITPVTFRRGNRSSPLPTPNVVLRGLQDSWNAFSGQDRRELDREHHERLWVSHISGSSEPMMVSGLKISGFIGQVVFRGDDQPTADLVDPLFRLAAYAGVGSGRAKGLGVTRLVQRRSARTTDLAR